MKKTLLFIFTLVAFSSVRLNAQFTLTNLNLPVQHSGVAVVDIDGDGDLDIIISGEDTSARNLQLYKNNGLGIFTPASSPFTPTTRTTFNWGDINQDGKLDLIMTGFPVVATPPVPPIDSVYTSNGTGTFTRDNAIALPQTAPTAGFADLNNDGYLDIYVFGNKDFGHAKIFFNNKAGGFTESNQFDAYNFVDPVVTPVDFDNDKDLDLFVMAGFEDAAGSRFSKMFVNNNGVFTIKDLGLIPKGNGSAVWGDYNGDGYLDLLLNGDGFLGSGEDDDGVYRLYKNNAGTSFSAVTTFKEYRQNNTGNGGRLIDWDNDGDLDVIVSGYNSITSTQATDIYLNNGGTFTAYAGNATIPGFSENSLETADIDGDGDLDIIESGYSANDFNGIGSAFNSNVSLIIRNPAITKNAAPSVPTGIKITGTQAAITFSWNASTDATTPQKALSYNMYLVNDMGKWFYYPLADTATGKLMLQKMGNMQLNKGWIVKNLPAGNYCWGVQTVDNSFASSKFARSCFTINSNGTLPVILASFSVNADGNRAKIQWTTTAEQNSDYFKVEHSTNGHDFRLLTTVKAQGNSSASKNYLVYDDYPSKGINYYKLTYYDKDGKPTVYDVKTASFTVGGKTLVVVSPNPVTTTNVGIRLTNYAGAQVALILTDLTGKVIHKEVIQTNQSQEYYKINLNTKPASGTYILKITGDNLNTGLKVFVN